VNGQQSTIYYRLKQVDYNGQYEYSPIRTLNFEPEPLNFSVYPNPVNNDRLFVSTIGNYQLFNARGVLLQSYASTSTLAIGALTKGSYYIRNEAGLVVPFIVN